MIRAIGAGRSTIKPFAKASYTFSHLTVGRANGVGDYIAKLYLLSPETGMVYEVVGEGSSIQKAVEVALARYSAEAGAESEVL